MDQFYEIVPSDELKTYPQLNIDNGIQLVMGDDVQFGPQQVILSQDQPNELQLIGNDSNQHLQQIVYQTAQQVPQQQHVQETNFLVQQEDGSLTDSYMSQGMTTVQQQSQQLSGQSQLQTQQLQGMQQQQIYYADESTGQLVHTANIVQAHDTVLDAQQQPTLHTMQTAAEQQLQQQQQLMHTQPHPIHQMPQQQQQQETQPQQLHQTSPQSSLAASQNQVVQVVQGIPRHGQHIILRSTDQTKQPLTIQQAQNHVFTNQNQPTQVLLQHPGTHQILHRQPHQQQQQQQQNQQVQQSQQQIVYEQLPQQSMSITQTVHQTGASIATNAGSLQQQQPLLQTKQQQITQHQLQTQLHPQSQQNRIHIGKTVTLTSQQQQQLLQQQHQNQAQQATMHLQQPGMASAHVIHSGGTRQCLIITKSPHQQQQQVGGAQIVVSQQQPVQMQTTPAIVQQSPSLIFQQQQQHQQQQEQQPPQQQLQQQQSVLQQPSAQHVVQSSQPQQPPIATPKLAPLSPRSPRAARPRVSKAANAKQARCAVASAAPALGPRPQAGKVTLAASLRPPVSLTTAAGTVTATPSQQMVQIIGKGNFVISNPRTKFLTINRPQLTTMAGTGTTGQPPRLAVMHRGNILQATGPTANAAPPQQGQGQIQLGQQQSQPQLHMGQQIVGTLQQTIQVSQTLTQAQSILNTTTTSAIAAGKQTTTPKGVPSTNTTGSLSSSSATGSLTIQNQLEDLEDSIQAAVLPRRNADESSVGTTATNSTSLPGNTVTGTIFAVSQQQQAVQVQQSQQQQQGSMVGQSSFADGTSNLIQLANGQTVTPAQFRTFQEKQQTRQQEALRGGFSNQASRMPMRGMVIRHRLPLGRRTVGLHVQQQLVPSQINVGQGQQQIQLPTHQLIQHSQLVQPIQHLQVQGHLQQITPTTTLQQVHAVVSQSESEFRESARMLVILQSGEQRLITFTLPKESCTVQELLEQVGVRYSRDSNIQCISNPGGDIDYIVTVGIHVSETADVIKQAEITIRNQSLQLQQQQLQLQQQQLQQQILQQQQQQQAQQQQQHTTMIQQSGVMQQPQTMTITLQQHSQPQQQQQVARFNDSFRQTIAPITLATSNMGGQPPTLSGAPDASELKREPPMKPVKGFLAVCASCGYTGADHAKCQRCRRVFNEPPRRIPEPDKTMGSPNPPPLTPNATSTPLTIGRKYDIYSKKQAMSTILSARGGRGGPSATRSGRGRGRGSVARMHDIEPVVLSLSSDEEDSSSGDRSKSAYKTALTTSSKINSSQQPEKRDPLPCEPTIADTDVGVGNDKPRLDITDVKNLPDGQITQLDCLTIWIGTLKYEANEKITLSSKGIRIVAPNVKRRTEYVSLDLQMSEIVKVLVHFSKVLNVMFVYTFPSCGSYIRKHLEMESGDGKLPYFSPSSRSVETQRRITLVMERISEESKSIIKNIFHGQRLDEISARDANDLLMRSSPRPSSDSSSSSGTVVTNGCTSEMLETTEIRKILIYPPGKGGISINTEDYMCLAKDQYLNDVIIDFYLNYLRLEMLEEEERASVHIFSTFFYNRLTTMSTRQRGSGAGDKDVKQTAAQKRHARVASWTKRENIFDRKFIVIPINEQSHWFLAIVCFPGLEVPITMVSNVPSSNAAKQNKPILKTKSSVTLQIGNTTITPVSKRGLEAISLSEDDEMCERDEAEGDESELASETEETDDEYTDVRQPIKQPCILIFDSLTGASRSRVVATLRDYLTCEYRVKMPGKPVKQFNKHNMPGHCVKVPQQNNYTDCGLYLLQYVEHFFLDPITDYHLPIKQLQSWFDTITVTKKREDISNLLKELIQKHNPSELPLPPIELPTLNGKLIIDPDDSTHDPEFEEEDMEDEEFVSALNTTADSEDRLSGSACDSGEITTDTTPPMVTSGSSLIKPIGSKRTFKIKRIGGQSLGHRSNSGNSLLDSSTTTMVAAESTTPAVTTKRALDTGSTGTNKLSQQDCLRAKAPRISDSPNKVATTTI